MGPASRRSSGSARHKNTIGGQPLRNAGPTAQAVGGRVLETVNAIARVRFSSARPQVVQLHKPGVAHVELLCMEAGQKLTVDKTPVAYYVITGSASIASAGKAVVAAAGHTVSLDINETHVVVSPPEGRLVCLMITT